MWLGRSGDLYCSAMVLSGVCGAANGLAILKQKSLHHLGCIVLFYTNELSTTFLGSERRSTTKKDLEPLWQTNGQIVSCILQYGISQQSLLGVLEFHDKPQYKVFFIVFVTKPRLSQKVARLQKEIVTKNKKDVSLFFNLQRETHDASSLITN